MSFLISTQGIKRLYSPKDIDRKKELRKLNHSILVNFLDLIDILIKVLELLHCFSCLDFSNCEDGDESVGFEQVNTELPKFDRDRKLNYGCDGGD